MPFLDWIALAGTVAFAVSGALLAARHRLDLVAFVFMANLTGIGGGTVRDLLLGVPVAWVRDPTALVLCSAAALATWVGARQFARIARGLLWADAVGIALFAVLGAQTALEHGAAPLVAVVMGVFSACLGGILRDVTLGDPPILLSREVYVTATVLGGGTYVALAGLLGSASPVATAAGIAAGFALRALAITRQLALPAHRGVDPA